MQSKYEPHHVSNKAKIGHLNTRSLCPKIDEIRCIVDKTILTFFCVSETWLYEYIKNDEKHVPGYNVFRKDRTTGEGGGVCIYVKETKHVNMTADLMFENIEAIWVEIRQGDTKYLVSCIYKPPSATTKYYEKIVDMFECARMTEHPVISLCDLDFNYILDKTLSTYPIHYVETAYGMHQLMDQPTRVDDKTSSVLDVILGVQFLNIHLVTTILYGIWKYQTIGGWSQRCEISWHEKLRYGEFPQWSNFKWHS